MLERNYEADSVATFRADSLPMIEWFRDNQPSLEQWREHQRAVLADRFATEISFVDYLKSDFRPLGILFAFLGLATAFGLVSRHTSDLRTAARQQLRAEREAEEAAAADEPQDEAQR